MHVLCAAHLAAEPSPPEMAPTAVACMPRHAPQVRDKQESKRNCSEDLHNLGEHFNATRAAKELAERDLTKVGPAGAAP